MFQMLTNVLLGEIKNVTAMEQEPNITEKEDDEWILVNYLDGCTNCCGEEADNIDSAVSLDYPELLSSSASSLELFGETDASHFIRFNSCPLEESWFITPPPCFTAVGLAGVQVETSPLENLLIEHPSMSVYGICNVHHRLKESGSRSVESEMSDLRTATQNKLGNRIRCYASVLAARSILLGEAKSLHLSQRAEQQIGRRQITQNRLRRQNLARDFQSRLTKQSGIFVHQPCQRQYNY
ncbi:tumor protein p53-inducible nuclear protein 1 [Protopterus annectens]|uniref:tumor protein p53-inducible nuclear protein 1 n=1 Tax=Protopterus annectens TaxID=7888 RepID=UPI001CFC04BD|nr:tumor protein p53-inducible nuclear protein 1 [Protopterus annectens]XP_043922508.1 tumor protein p53-inducible nuclear protein 1 [Protopterus annectens]